MAEPLRVRIDGVLAGMSTREEPITAVSVSWAQEEHDTEYSVLD